jgi:glycosyltransferase involved in cell wall biosynthesis
VRLCFVIQRFGEDVTGGAETHCRWLAGRMARRHQVEIVTTCARDYADWSNHYPAGQSSVAGLPVTRFPVTRPRSARMFSFYSDAVFHDRFTPDDERAWLEENGPLSPALVEALPRLQHVDLFVFYSYRYYTTYYGLKSVASRAVLVPTAEDDAAVRLPIFRELLRRPRGILYLTPEERSLVQEVSDNSSVASAVIGSGLELASGWESLDVHARFSLPPRYLLYVGRIDWSKGVDKLVDYYKQLADEWPDMPPLMLAGKAMMELPEHPKLRLLGEVPEADKLALMANCDVLLLPSIYESLSIAVLEAWALGKPVLVNGECRVLEGQCLRSNGGLFYRKYAEFAPALRLLLVHPGLREAMGRAGQEYVRREYNWDLVEKRTQALLETIVQTPLR